MLNIPILTYHKISDYREFGLTTISKKQFDLQMNYLKLNGYRPLCLKDLKSERSLPEKPVIITFDDGYENVYQNAVPVLNKYDFKAVIFVVTNYIGQMNTWEAAPFQQKFKHLSEDQIIDLNNNGHEIASHSKMHRYLPSLRNDRLIDEICGSKTYLESLLGEHVTSFCYPFGGFSKKIEKIVKKAGYHFATTNLKISTRNKVNPLSLSRRSVYMTDSFNIFISKVISPEVLNISYFTEIIIQKGALASIGLTMLRDSKSYF